MTRSSRSASPLARSLAIVSSSNARPVAIALFVLLTSHVCSGAYYGKLIGKLKELHHGVSGEVYAVDGRTLYLKDFTYDGEGPAAYFYAGSSKSPNVNGFRVRDERGTTDVLKKYRKKGITLTLPEGKTLNNIKWFSVWCDEFAVNFGDVKIPRGFDYPRPQKLAGLNGIHGISSEPIVIVDAQTLLIPGFNYDGEAPDAKFWAGPGAHPTPQGERVPDENGKTEPLRRYDRKTIVLTLPGDLTIHQLGHFGVWCEAFTVDFGHVQIPASLNVPPSLKMLGVSPQNLREGQGREASIIGYAASTLSRSTRERLHPLFSDDPSYRSESTEALTGIVSLPEPETARRYDERPTTYRPASPYRRRSDDGPTRVAKSLGRRAPEAEARLENDSTAIAPGYFEPSGIRVDEEESSSLSPGTPPSTISYPKATTRMKAATGNRQPEISGPIGRLALDEARRRAPQESRQRVSYSRLRNYQGDRAVDSYIRY